VFGVPRGLHLVSKPMDRASFGEGVPSRKRFVFIPKRTVPQLAARLTRALRDLQAKRVHAPIQKEETHDSSSSSSSILQQGQQGITSLMMPHERHSQRWDLFASYSAEARL